MGYQNFYAAKLYADIGSTDTTITVDVPPSSTSGRLALEARNASQREIIKYTGVSGNTLTGVLRGQGGTTARAHLKNSLVEMNVTGEDLQDILDAFNSFAATNNDWRNLIPSFVYAANNGNGEYVANANGDVTALLYPGMKLKVPRVVAPATQAMLFQAASSQFATKATPTGINFTSAFTIECMVYLNSYGTGGQSQHLVSRRNGGDGFDLEIQTNGQISIYYGSGGINRSITSLSECLPLKKWVHVAIVVSSVSTATGAIYVNGRPVVTATTGSGTALTQGGNMTLGQYNGGGFFADTYMGEVRIWSVAQTQAQIQANMNVALTGAEANLVGLWQGNGNFNDKTANANHLTPSGGATATTLMSTLLSAYANPTEYFYVTKVGAFSGGVTPVTLFGGTDGHLPNASLGTVQYSTARSPFGFPAGRDRWTLRVLCRVGLSANFTVAGAWHDFTNNLKLTVPIGSWKLSFAGDFGQSNSSAATVDNQYGIDSFLPVSTAMMPLIMGRTYTQNGTTYHSSSTFNQSTVTVTTPTSYGLYAQLFTGGGSVAFQIRGDRSVVEIAAELAYE